MNILIQSRIIIFQALESPHECFRSMNHRSFFVGYFLKEQRSLPIGNTNLTSYISEQRKNYNGENTPEIDLDCEKWDFYNSFVFTFTASTTIGYGQLSPVTAQGSYFAAKLEAFQDSGDDSDSDDELKKKGELFKFCSIMFNIIIYLIPGVAVFVLIPALIFHYIEGWSYLDSVYYAYITLTTIGFGDFAAGRNNDILRSLDSWSLIYESFILIWIISFLKRIIEEVVNKRNKEYEKNGSMDGLTLENHDKDLVMENDLYLSVNDMEDDDKAHLEFKNKLVEDKEEDNEDPSEGFHHMSMKGHVHEAPMVQILKPSITDMSFSEFLKNTTLEEFFVAANSISSPRNSVHNDPNVSSANSPQNSIHTGMKKLSTMASSGLEPFSKLFSNGTPHGTSQRRASSFSTSNRVSEPPTQIIVTSYSSASSESKDNEIRI
ncbi:unnamed protein product [Lepeophtheirus salmonis]|uniref:(salmon louse) hypothetical protein n=1 Tax=Lepeophtheirus salmonis TaxID=72036 RepID=A0A7R8CKG7_LEPSM|nr:unnamed protein product [Lepeophtheirus salmonis]CAF2845320.1 unnamed protein product [Lepeophtheirus salmonis]